MVLDFLAKRTVQPNDCVMFDIDDTLIRVDGTPISEVINLLRVCQILGYKIVIITARPYYPENTKWTKQQLAHHGITYDLLAYAPPQHKTTTKKHLMKERGWKFVLSVGDLDTDLTDSEAVLKISTCYYS
jgi:ribonucleotide monophosphatase NagD (HAD superfamily)